ncbi:MAG: type II secretion system F family protein [Acidimicrobiia bacterium]|nr:type II secretion system F family protein [Acidimicrobiia bacterium]
MTIAAALVAAGAAVFLLVPSPPAPLERRVGQQLAPDEPEAPGRRRPPAAALGAAIGLVAAIGVPLVVGTPPRVPLAAVGAGLGAWMGWARRRSERDRRARRETASVPTVADALALHVLAGDGVVDAIDRCSRSMRGEVVDALAAAAAADDALPVALLRRGSEAASSHAARLYEVLAHAHTSGGRLADTLTRLATDVRAAIARDLTAEGGRRALAGYGPILALMVPTTLLFLMYPTVVGLTSLS